MSCKNTGTIAASLRRTPKALLGKSLSVAVAIYPIIAGRTRFILMAASSSRTL